MDNVDFQPGDRFLVKSKHAGPPYIFGEVANVHLEIYERLSLRGSPVQTPYIESTNGVYYSLDQIIKVPGGTNNTSPERIYCSAIWYKDIEALNYDVQPINIRSGLVVLGHRHGDIIRNVGSMLGLRTVQNGERAAGEYIQGFLTTRNRFVGRKEAAQIAQKENQIKDLGRFNPEHLYSEDLY